jgi:hypothetical protein
MATARKKMLSDAELDFLNPSETPQQTNTVEGDPEDEMERIKQGKEPQTMVRFTVDLPEPLHKELRMLSVEKNVKMTEIVRIAIKKVVAELKDS